MTKKVNIIYLDNILNDLSKAIMPLHNIIMTSCNIMTHDILHDVISFIMLSYIWTCIMMSHVQTFMYYGVQYNRQEECPNI